MYNTSAQKAQLNMTMMAVPRAIVFCAETEMPGHGKAPSMFQSSVYVEVQSASVLLDGLLRRTLNFQIAWA
jgi:hypothetical protein